MCNIDWLDSILLQEWRRVLESQAASDRVIESEAVMRERELERLRVEEVIARINCRKTCTWVLLC